MGLKKAVSPKMNPERPKRKMKERMRKVDLRDDNDDDGKGRAWKTDLGEEEGILVGVVVAQ